MNRRDFLLSSAAFLPQPAAADSSVPLTIDPSRKLGVIPAGFIGLGYEISTVANGVLDGANRDYVAAVKRLGPGGVIRIGGNTSDDAFYRAREQPRSLPKGTIVNLANLRGLGSFFQSTGWKLIWGLNLGSGSVPQAVEEAQAVTHAVGDKVLAFEIGNEPDLFRRSHRAANYTYHDWLLEYRAYKAAIRRVLPHARFAGPDAAVSDDWVTRFAHDEGNDLVLLTHHYYRECAGPTSTIEKLLNADPKLASELEQLRAASQAAHIPYRVCEVNSFCGGGKEGVSGTLAAALWVLDYMFTLAAAGAAGVNIETGVNQLGWMSWYSPLTTRNGQLEIHPEYFGMLAFSLSSRGERVFTNFENEPTHLTAYAVIKAPGELVITIINKDLHQDAAISINAGRHLAARNLVRLTGPSLTSRSGVSLRPDMHATLRNLAVPAGSAAILSCSLA